MRLRWSGQEASGAYFIGNVLTVALLWHKLRATFCVETRHAKLKLYLRAHIHP
jgi:hypothetical protein